MADAEHKQPKGKKKGIKLTFDAEEKGMLCREQCLQFVNGCAVTSAAVAEKFAAIMRLRGKPGTTVQSLVEFLTSVRKSVDEAGLGAATSLKLLLALITVNFDEKAETKSFYLSIPTWHTFAQRNNNVFNLLVGLQMPGFAFGVV